MRLSSSRRTKRHSSPAMSSTSTAVRATDLSGRGANYGARSRGDLPEAPAHPPPHSPSRAGRPSERPMWGRGRAGVGGRRGGGSRGPKTLANALLLSYRVRKARPPPRSSPTRGEETRRSDSRVSANSKGASAEGPLQRSSSRPTASVSPIAVSVRLAARRSSSTSISAELWIIGIRP